MRLLMVGASMNLGATITARREGIIATGDSYPFRYAQGLECRYRGLMALRIPAAPQFRLKNFVN